jgi:ABC-2 type transport system permease protein
LIEVEGFVCKAFAMVQVETTKLRRDPTEILSRAIQPALWMLLFGQVMSRSRVINTGSLRYLDFMAPGILAQSVLFTSIFYGLSAIWEKDLGILQKYLVSPAPRSALVAGKALSAGIRGLIQSVFVYVLSVILGVHLNWHPLDLLGGLLAILMGAAFFSTFSLIIACIVKSRERFMGIGQVMTMPLFFASNAIYPIAMMPPWLKTVSHLNPLTYQVDMLRSTMIVGGTNNYPIGLDLLVLVVATIAAILIAARLYPGLAQ